MSFRLQHDLHQLQKRLNWVFPGLDAQVVTALAQSATRFLLSPGERMPASLADGQVVVLTAGLLFLDGSEDLTGQGEVHLRLLCPPAMVRLPAVLQGAQAEAPQRLFSLQLSECLAIDEQVFDQVMQDSPHLQYLVMSRLCDMLRDANSRVRSLALQSVGGRLEDFRAYWRAQATLALGSHVQPTISDVARFIGASRESIYRVMRASDGFKEQA